MQVLLLLHSALSQKTMSRLATESVQCTINVDCRLQCTMCIYLSSRRPQAMDGTCKFNASNVGATIKSWTDVASGSEPDLQKVGFNNQLDV